MPLKSNASFAVVAKTDAPARWIGADATAPDRVRSELKITAIRKRSGTIFDILVSIGT